MTERFESLNDTTVRLLAEPETDDPPKDESMRFVQPLSQALFDFTANAMAMFDNIAFACFAICSMVRPRAFQLDDAKDRRRVDWGRCVAALAKPEAFPADESSRAFKQADGSDVMGDLRSLRNLYMHRGSPMVFSYAGGPMLHSRNRLQGDIGIDESTALYFLELLVLHVTRLVETLERFAVDRLPATVDDGGA